MRKRVRWGRSARLAGLALCVTLTGVMPTVFPASLSVYAAEAQQGVLTKEQAIERAKTLVNIPVGYTNRTALYEDEDFYGSGPVWSLHWEHEKEGWIRLLIDAKTGTLVNMYRYTGDRVNQPEKPISQEAAAQAAAAFLERVTAKEERDKLSQPNAYPPSRDWAVVDQPGMYSFVYTRMENQIPFLENGFLIVIGEDGQVLQFQRRWYQGPLPQAAAQDVAKKLGEAVRPSLAYVSLGLMTGDYGAEANTFSLVYRYSPTDPAMIDAQTKAVLNALGEEVTEPEPIQPLGTTSANKPDKTIGKEEAQKIADQVIARLPGTYHFEGNNGYGSGTGPDGIVRRNWSFQYRPENAKDNSETIDIAIDDRGRISQFRIGDHSFMSGRGKPIESAVSWETARDNAVALVKLLYADRLGEIYLFSRKPSEEQLQRIKKDGQLYAISFGWLVGGVPVDTTPFTVHVDPESGKAVEVWGSGNEELDDVTVAATHVDVEAAKKAEAEKKQPMLTYFLPQPDWRYDSASVSKQPRLVYRYVGEDGVVDAVSGKWISFAELRKKMSPQDIDRHPAKEALQFAVRQDLLKVTDGKVEPDKLMTRGEFAMVLARFANRYPLVDRFHSSDQDDPPYMFQDVDAKSPVFPFLQQLIRANIIDKTSRFEPERPITRVEAAKMIDRLLGFTDLLAKPEVFRSPFTDVAPADVPAVALVHALGLMTAKQGKVFQPTGTLTRADVAVILKRLDDNLRKDR